MFDKSVSSLIKKKMRMRFRYQNSQNRSTAKFHIIQEY